MSNLNSIESTVKEMIRSMDGFGLLSDLPPQKLAKRYHGDWKIEGNRTTFLYNGQTMMWNMAVNQLYGTHNCMSTIYKYLSDIKTYCEEKQIIGTIYIGYWQIGLFMRSPMSDELMLRATILEPQTELFTWEE